MPHIQCCPGPPCAAELRASGTTGRTHSCLDATAARPPPPVAPEGQTERSVDSGERPTPASDPRRVPFDRLHQRRGLNRDFILYFPRGGLAFPRTTRSFLWEPELITCNFFQAAELCWWIMAWKVHSGRLQTAPHSSSLVSCRNLASQRFLAVYFLLYCRWQQTLSSVRRKVR